LLFAIGTAGCRDVMIVEPIESTTNDEAGE
jgi:hypothetical protein